MKSLRKFIILLIFIILPAILNLSCKSNFIPIPGNKSILLKNIYIEYSKLGDAYFDIGRYSDAVSFYNKAMEDKDLYWPCFYKAAKCYVYSSNWNKSLEMYNILLDKDPENSSLKASIAYIYSMNGDLINALNIYKELLLLQPNNEKFLENYLAILLSDKEIFNNNKDDFEQQFNFFKDNYSKNTNIKIFQDKYDEFTKLPENDNKKSEEILE